MTAPPLGSRTAESGKVFTPRLRATVEDPTYTLALEAGSYGLPSFGVLVDHGPVCEIWGRIVADPNETFDPGEGRYFIPLPDGHPEHALMTGPVGEGQIVTVDSGVPLATFATEFDPALDAAFGLVDELGVRAHVLWMFLHGENDAVAADQVVAADNPHVPAVLLIVAFHASYLRSD